jgi:hypothetical protein
VTAAIKTKTEGRGALGFSRFVLQHTTRAKFETRNKWKWKWAFCKHNWGVFLNSPKKAAVKEKVLVRWDFRVFWVMGKGVGLS